MSDPAAELKSMTDTLETGQVTHVNLTAVLARVRERLGTELLDHADVRLICDELEAARELLDVTCRHGLERDAAMPDTDLAAVVKAARNEARNQYQGADIRIGRNLVIALCDAVDRLQAEVKSAQDDYDCGELRTERDRLSQLLTAMLEKCRGCNGYGRIPGAVCSECGPIRAAMEAKS